MSLSLTARTVVTLGSNRGVLDQEVCEVSWVPASCHSPIAWRLVAGIRHRASLLALSTDVLVALAEDGFFLVGGPSRASRRRVHLVEPADLQT
jgi:hypothetical protein